LRFLVGDEVGADVASVEFHALDELDLVVQGFAVGNGDGAVLADLLHQLGDQVSDLRVAVGGNCGHVGDHFLGFNRLAAGLEVGHDGFDGDVDAPFEVHGVEPGGDAFAALSEDGSGEDCGGGCSVAGLVVGFIRNLFNEGSTHVHEFISEFDVFGYGNSVFCDFRGAEALVDNDVSSYLVKIRNLPFGPRVT
jgi:hypothetical protein